MVLRTSRPMERWTLPTVLPLLRRADVPPVPCYKSKVSHVNVYILLCWPHYISIDAKQVLIIAVIFLLCSDNVDVTWAAWIVFHPGEVTFLCLGKCQTSEWFNPPPTKKMWLHSFRLTDLWSFSLVSPTWRGACGIGECMAYALTIILVANSTISSNPVDLRGWV